MCVCLFCVVYYVINVFRWLDCGCETARVSVLCVLIFCSNCVRFYVVDQVTDLALFVLLFIVIAEANQCV